MKRREKEYSTFRNISLLIRSWNIDSRKPSDLEKLPDEKNFLLEWIKHSSTPDLVIIGLQELVDLESVYMKTFCSSLFRNQYISLFFSSYLALIFC